MQRHLWFVLFWFYDFSFWFGHLHYRWRGYHSSWQVFSVTFKKNKCVMISFEEQKRIVKTNLPTFIITTTNCNLQNGQFCVSKLGMYINSSAIDPLDSWMPPILPYQVKLHQILPNKRLVPLVSSLILSASEGFVSGTVASLTIGFFSSCSSGSTYKTGS